MAAWQLLEQNRSLLLTGFAAGVVVGLARRVLGRRCGAGSVVIALLVALSVSGRFDLPVPHSLAALAGALVTVAAVMGTARVLAPPARWEPVAVGAVISAGAVWAAVPETGPAVVVGGVVTALAVTARVTGARWTARAGSVVAAAIGWAAASGASGRPWAALGGALCAGMAPWFALVRPGSSRSRREPTGAADPAGGAGPSGRAGRAGIPAWVLAAHAVLALVAARWVAVDAHAGWLRAVLVAGAGLAVALAARP